LIQFPIGFVSTGIGKAVTLSQSFIHFHERVVASVSPASETRHNYHTHSSSSSSSKNENTNKYKNPASILENQSQKTMILQ